MNRGLLMTRYSPLLALRRHYDRQLPTWLSAAEHTELERIRNALRREQWICGRWLGKSMIRSLTRNATIADIEILSRSKAGLGMRPTVTVSGRSIDISLSLSHTARGLFIGLASGNGLSVGVDLSSDVPSSRSFRRQWFTDVEQRWLDQEPRRRTEILWALKEAFFKAGNTGQPWAPRRVEIIHDNGCFQGQLFGQRTRTEQVALQNVDGQLAATVCLARSSLFESTDESSEWVICS